MALFSVCYKSATGSGSATGYRTAASRAELWEKLPATHPQYDGYVLNSIDGFDRDGRALFNLPATIPHANLAAWTAGNYPADNGTDDARHESESGIPSGQS